MGRIFVWNWWYWFMFIFMDLYPVCFGASTYQSRWFFLLFQLLFSHIMSGKMDDSHGLWHQRKCMGGLLHPLFLSLLYRQSGSTSFRFINNNFNYTLLIGLSSTHWLVFSTNQLLQTTKQLGDPFGPAPGQHMQRGDKFVGLSSKWVVVVHPYLHPSTARPLNLSSLLL